MRKLIEYRKESHQADLKQKALMAQNINSTIDVICKLMDRKLRTSEVEDLLTNKLALSDLVSERFISTGGALEWNLEGLGLSKLYKEAQHLLNGSTTVYARGYFEVNGMQVAVTKEYEKSSKEKSCIYAENEKQLATYDFLESFQKFMDSNKDNFQRMGVSGEKPAIKFLESFQFASFKNGRVDPYHNVITHKQKIKGNRAV